MRKLAVFLALAGVAWSQSNVEPRQPAPVDCTGDFLPPDDHPRLFPVDPDNFGPGGAGTIRRYACVLRAMGELPLLEPSHESGTERIRLLVIPVYRPPFVVRLIIMPDGAGELEAKAAESQRNPAVLTLDRETKVSKEEVEEFLKLLDEAKFWSMQTNQFYAKEQVAMARTFPPKRRKIEIKILDGVHWVLEEAQAENYHVVTRTSPEPGPYANLTSYLFHNLGKLEIPP